MRFEVSDVHVERPLQNRWDVLLAICGTIVVKVGAVTIYEEEQFPLVEFGAQLSVWMKAGADQEFRYTSLESDVEGLVRFSPLIGGMWRIWSSAEGCEAVGEVAQEDLLAAAASYLDELRVNVPDEVDLAEFI
jgi:hypothetical protein